MDCRQPGRMTTATPKIFFDSKTWLSANVGHYRAKASVVLNNIYRSPTKPEDNWLEKKDKHKTKPVTVHSQGFKNTDSATFWQMT